MTKTQIQLAFGESHIICMVCGQPGATIPYHRATGRLFDCQGVPKQVLEFGFRHEECEEHEIHDD